MCQLKLEVLILVKSQHTSEHVVAFIVALELLLASISLSIMLKSLAAYLYCSKSPQTQAENTTKFKFES